MLLYYIILLYILYYRIVYYRIVLHYRIIYYRIVLHYRIILYYRIVLYYIILYYRIILYYIILYIRIKFDCYNLTGGEMNIKVDVNYLKPEEQNMQTGMLATESVRCQEVILPRVSATSAASGSASCPQIEDLHTRKEEMFLSIVYGYFNAINPQSIEEFNRFMEYAEKTRLVISGFSKGSLVITVKCESLMILEDLWTDYSSGHLDEVVQNCFVTEKILKGLNLAELRLKTTMDIEEYNACKMFFEKDALRGW